MTDNPMIESSFDILSAFTLGEATLADTLQRLSEVARDVVVPAEFVGMTMCRGGQLVTPIYTDDHVLNIDAAQYRDDTGPCVDSYREGNVILVDSVEDSGDQWPSFREEALHRGINSVLSVPMRVQGEPVGAANFYASKSKVFTEPDERLATLFALQAGVVAANAARYWDVKDLAGQLDDAVVSRDVIGQAKGILMASSNLTGDEAFDLLRRASQRENRKLREVAEEIVARHEERVAAGQPPAQRS